MCGVVTGNGSKAGGEAGDSGEGILCAFGSERGKAWQGGKGAAFGAGGGGGYFGGGGGGAAPGLVGGGGGGSSYALRSVAIDVAFVQGSGWRSGGWGQGPGTGELVESADADNSDADGRLPGGHPRSGSNQVAAVSSAAASASPAVSVSLLSPYDPMDATGMHELDKVGGKVGEGGQGSPFEALPGKHGGVRLLRPGFYKDFDTSRDNKPYMGDPQRQELLLPIGKPIRDVMDEAKAAHEKHQKLMKDYLNGV
jgi:hypothetical protein